MSKPGEGQKIPPQTLKNFLNKQNAWRTALHGTPGGKK